MKRFKHSTRQPLKSLLWILSVVTLCSTTSTSNAQNSSAQQAARKKMYDQLAKDVKEIERFTGILKRVVHLSKSTVVHIEAKKNSSGRSVEEAGSGVVIKRKGKFYVITNRHVIDGTNNSEIKIRLSNAKEIYPSRVWQDAGTDIAIMQVDSKALSPARIGNSDKVDIGDFVLAVGSPFGLSHSITFGIVSAKGRHDLELGAEGVKFQNFLQTDAAINPGNSGGPLFNLRGEVIGINTAIASNSGGNNGIGFTIPINMVNRITDQLIEHNVVQRAFLGVNLDNHFTATRARREKLPYGALVLGTTPESPAEKAKFKSGDVVISFNGKRIDNDNHLVNEVGLTPIGKEVSVTVYRAGKQVKISVKVGNRSKFKLKN